MRKGISPIVSIVLLIAISVIAAVALYFWVGGAATKQPASEKPHTIQAICSDGAILITDNSPSGTSKDVMFTSTNATEWNCNVTLSPGKSDLCRGNIPSGESGSLQPNATGVSIAAYTC